MSPDGASARESKLLLRGFIDRVRSGDLGMLPVAVGLVIISVVFSSRLSCCEFAL